MRRSVYKVENEKSIHTTEILKFQNRILKIIFFFILLKKIMKFICNPDNDQAPSETPQTLHQYGTEGFEGGPIALRGTCVFDSCKPKFQT